jgi:hypothetical protein
MSCNYKINATQVLPGNLQFQDVECGRKFTTSNVSFQTPNWSQTYLVNLSCEWFIELPNAQKVVKIINTCIDDLYGIAGIYPECTEDYIRIYDGNGSQSITLGPYCGFTKSVYFTLDQAMPCLQSRRSPCSARSQQLIHIPLQFPLQ